MFRIRELKRSLVLLVLTGLLAVASQAGARQTPRTAQRVEGAQKRVLILSDISRNAITHQALESAVMSVVRAEVPDPVNLYTEHLDVMRFPEKSIGPALGQFLETKYAAVPPSVIMTFGPYSLRYIMRYGPQVFPGVPVVFVGGTFPDVPRPPEFTGVSDSVNFAEIVELALQLQPETKQVYVVSGAALFDRPWHEQARRGLAALESRVKLGYLAGLPMTELEDSLSILPPNSIVLYLPISQDGSGTNWTVWTALEHVTAAANAPVYAWHEVAIRHGALAIRGRDLRVVGITAGQMVVRILRGTPAADIPIVHATSRNVLNWPELQRWQIDSKRIPAGSVLQNRSPSAWEHYRTQILVALFVVLLQTILIVALLIQRTRRRRAEALAREAEAALRRSYDQVQDLARRLITAQEVERARIARDLHDDVNQQLAVLSIRLSDLYRRLPGNELRSRVEWLQQRAGILIETVRSMSHDLHPGILQQAGLAAALRSVCSEISSEHGLAVAVEVQQNLPTMPAATSLGLFRIAQEALHNVARHARARRAELRLRYEHGFVQLEVTDDGCGFEANGNNTGGLGILNMQERAGLLGGELFIGAAPGGGTLLRLRAPLTVPELTQGSAIPAPAHLAYTSG